MFTPGTLILDNTYRIERELGHGAFGVVYLATHQSLQVARAIKTLRHDAPGVGSTLYSDYRNRFRLEAQLGARLTHPNVIQVYDFLERDDVLYCIMEYAPGGSLADLMARQAPLPIERTVALIKEAALGLQALHDKADAVHRDVKPSNLLLDKEGQIKVGDLGLAQVGGLGQSQRSVLGSLAPPHPGTPNYASPEYTNGMEALGPTADVYGLGCVAFELLTGQTWKSARRRVDRVSELRSDTPPWLDALVARMLCETPGISKRDIDDPTKRYVDMGGVLAVLAKAAAQEEDARRQAERLRAAEVAAAAQAERQRAEAEVQRKREEEVASLQHEERERRAAEEAAIAVEARRKQDQAEAERKRTLYDQQVRAAQIEREKQRAGRARRNWWLVAGLAVLMSIFLYVYRGAFAIPGAYVSAPDSSSPGAITTDATSVSVSVQGASIDTSETVLIPAGPFQMGCSPDDYLCDDNEKPLHMVTLDAYAIDKYEVTNARYKACVDAGACTPPQQVSSATHDGNSTFADYPVINVDWSQADAFCTWEGKSLPTEAEWEKAARGSDDTRIYPWGNDAPTDKLLNFGQNVGDTTAVGSYPEGASPYGVMDMGGNVWEWVNDWFDSEYYSNSPASNPTGPTTGYARVRTISDTNATTTTVEMMHIPSPGDGRVVRGGSWLQDGLFARGSKRFLLVPESRNFDVGFRCVGSPENSAAVQTPNASQAVAGSAPATAPAISDDAILIPAGPFQMGCSPDDDLCEPDETPLHTVTLDAYEIDKYEVTNARYAACVVTGACDGLVEDSSATHDSYYGNADFADYPVIWVAWSQADAFCAWEGKRLPTEAEWEKAARGSDDTRIYPWGNETPSDNLLNFNNDLGDTSKVGSYSSGASPYGVMDMSGNESEWVADWYRDSYYSTSPDANPTGPKYGDYRVMRGGGWSGNDGDARSSNRGWVSPNKLIELGGFRCVRSLADSTGAHAPDSSTSGAIVTDTTTLSETIQVGSIDTGETVLIPAGPFQMGCSPDDNQCIDNEKPLHTVTLATYTIDKYEVTNARYAACVAAGGCTPALMAGYYDSHQVTDYPIMVDWYQADAFCKWEGRRLPTEAEWEKAARGDADTRIYPWGNEVPDCARANFFDEVINDFCVGDMTHVGSYPTGASPYGVMNMSDNLSEWVNDWYSEDYYSRSPAENPEGPDEGSDRVTRGGTYRTIGTGVRTSLRSYSYPEGNQDTGFRCASSH